MISMKRIHLSLGILLSGTLAIQACGDESAPVPTALTTADGIAASATVGTSVPVAVVVSDAGGKAVSGVPVTFEVRRGGGTVVSSSRQTDRNGRASTEWTLGTEAGTNELIASSGSLPTATVTVTGTPDNPAAVTAAEDNPATAGVADTLAPAPAVRVVDRHGNGVPDVEVKFTTGIGSGSVTGGTQVTGQSGMARPTSWILGSTAGTQTLTARAGTLTANLKVEAAARAAGRVTVTAGAEQTGTVGRAAPRRPTVRVTDTFGNVVPGVAVQFTVTAGGGSIADGSQVADADGLAQPGDWTLGTQAGENVLTASIEGGAEATMIALGQADDPASLEIAAGNGQEARPNATVDTVPLVRVMDQYGNGTAGVNVAFEVTSGGGAVSDASAVTDSAGEAHPGAWMLGGTEGENTLRATAAGVDPVTFTATAKGEPAAQFTVQKFAGDGTTCPVSSEDCRFTVRVVDAVGEPAPGQTVTWSDAGGSTFSSVTNMRGHATAANLTQHGSPTTATQTARLSTDANAQVTFSYEAVQAGQYNIDMRFIGSATSSQQAIITSARERWEQVITGNLSSVSMSVDAGTCSVDHPQVNETIDDLLIFVEVVHIDGPGGTLGSAGPCYIRTSNELPIIGAIKLDSADVSAMESNGTLYEVVLHEIGHVLGIGVLWSRLGLLEDAGTSDPFFNGARAIPSFELAGGELINGVPVENCLTANGDPISGCGSGTRDSHWRESDFSTELMSGYISNSGNPLSAVTVGSLLDMSYQVNFGVADAYSMPGAALRAHGGEELIELRELPMPPPRYVRDR